MREVFIKYNPYKLQTEIAIDGKPVKKNSRLNIEENHRLQEWIEELPNNLVDECNSKNFKIIFHGTILDYEDLLSVVKDARDSGFTFECEHIPAKEVKDKENAIQEIFDEIQRGPFEELKQPDVIKAFELAKSSEFPVNVIATMSAGKSTLINALLQQKLMPAKQEACTATITEIKDNDSDTFMATVYDKNGDLIEACPVLTLTEMNKFNSNPEVSKIRVNGNIPFVNSDNISLVLVDTPGPNNSRDPEHKAATYRMLSESSKTLVIYVLNATQLETLDDDVLLNHVADSMKVGGKQSKDRFIFVINKMDEFKKGQDNVSDTINKARQRLEDKEIKNPSIYPLSALTALNIRTILKDKRVTGYTDEEREDMEENEDETITKISKFIRNSDLHFENQASLTPSTKAKIVNDLEKAKTLADRSNKNVDLRSEGMKELALIHSGIIPIESAINMYVQKYAKTAKIKNIVDTFLKKLESQQSFENTRKEIATNQDKQKEILEQISNIQSKLKSGEKAKQFKEKLDKINYDKEVRDVSNKIILKAQKKIEPLFSSNDGELSKLEAESKCGTFAKFAEDLQAQVQIELEEIVTHNVEKNAKDLLEQYKAKLSDLTLELTVGDVSINPFEMMSGDISALSNVSKIINSSTKTEKVETRKRVPNTKKKWFKPWTWFQSKEFYEHEYKNREYVDGSELATKFFAPVQDALMSNANSAVDYAKTQTRQIKNSFKQKFDELDGVLKTKLMQLENCASDKQSVEKIIKETQNRLNWLEQIQDKIQDILDI